MNRLLRAAVAAAALAGMASFASAQGHSGHSGHAAGAQQQGAMSPSQGAMTQPQQQGAMHDPQHGAMHHAQQGAMHHPQMMGNAPASAGSRELHQSMMAGMQDMQRKPMTGDVDKDFIRMMRQHHLQGIEMARIQSQKGDDPEAKRMAQKIIEQQQKEIAQFDSWLQRHQ